MIRNPNPLFRSGSNIDYSAAYLSCLNKPQTNIDVAKAHFSAAFPNDSSSSSKLDSSSANASIPAANSL
jgi:hypothetical protein